MISLASVAFVAIKLDYTRLSTYFFLDTRGPKDPELSTYFLLVCKLQFMCYPLADIKLFMRYS